jgi:hypothetical protein
MILNLSELIQWKPHSPKAICPKGKPLGCGGCHDLF